MIKRIALLSITSLAAVTAVAGCDSSETKTSHSESKITAPAEDKKGAEKSEKAEKTKDADKTKEADKPKEDKIAKKAKWSYKGSTGPEEWANLPGYKECAGEAQSPIDVKGAKDAKLTDIKFNYNPSELNVVNNGHTVQMNYDKGSSIDIDGTTFDLLQFHYHAPSEHTIDGKSFPMEIHFVHQSAAGKLAVVGIMVDGNGKDSKALAEAVENMPKEKDGTFTGTSKINAADLLPKDQSTFRYSGSLTTPPCSEGVAWHLMKKPVSISKSQLAAFEKAYKGNNRPVQKLNDRKLSLDKSDK